MDLSGFEPEAPAFLNSLSCMQGRCSITPHKAIALRVQAELQAHNHKNNVKVWYKKGGDPAAGSPTATLWRLNPSHRAQIRIIP